MVIRRWYANLRGASRKHHAPRPHRARPLLEHLEHRLVPSTLTEAEPNDGFPQADGQGLYPVPTGDVLTTDRSGKLTIVGDITGSDGIDLFKFTLASPAGVFFDIDGSTNGLDSILTLYDSTAAHHAIASNDNGYDFEGTNTPEDPEDPDLPYLDSSLYADLPAGTYYIGVSSSGGTTGQYILRILADTLYTRAVPQLSSRPSAADTLYLDFDGHTGVNDVWGSYTAAAFDFNGNTATFSPAERLCIRNIWRMVGEDFSIFNLNVTTVEPTGAGAFADGVGFRQVITSSSPTVVNQSGTALGRSKLSSYATTGSAPDNVGFTFAANFDHSYGGGLSGQIIATPVELGNTSSEQFGRALGLRPYDTTTTTRAIMGEPEIAFNLEIWRKGTNDLGNPQDDVAVIKSPTNTFGLVPDDYGDTVGTAEPLTASRNSYSRPGIIAPPSDRDVFRFVGSGSTKITVDVDQYINNLDANLRLFNSAGAQIAVGVTEDSFDATLTTNLPPGTYYVEASSVGGDYYYGQYQVIINTTVILPNSANLSTREDTDLAGTVSATTLVGNPLTYSVVSQPAHGSVTITDSSTGAFVYHPNPDYFTTSTPDSFTFKASDSNSNSNTATVSITVNPVNDAPTFNRGPDQLVPEDSGSQAVAGWATAISAGPPNESGQALTFLVSNNNNALFSAQPSVSAAGTLSYTPAANAFGTATVSVRLRDDGGTANGGVDTSAAQTFTISVASVNDVPSFTKGADQSVPEDAGPQPVAGWATAISAGPPNESGQALTFLVSNDNNALFSAQPSISAAGTLSYTPAANAFGTATVSVRLQDSGGTANGGVDTSAAQTFTISVASVNDAPSFTKGADQAVLEDSGSQAVAGWATAISAGPPNESGQAVSFQVGNNNTALFSAQPSVSAAGTLSYTPAANAFGTATVSVRLQDDGGTANGGVNLSTGQTFTITVAAVNDAPAFTEGGDQTVLEDSGSQAVVGWATAISAGPPNESGQSLSFQVGNDNNALFSAQPSISAAGTLTYTPSANANGTATVTVRLQDNGGTAGGGVDTSATRTFTINVTPVNDVPAFTRGADQLAPKDGGVQSVSGWATAISAGPPNESGQALTFLVSNDNNALFSAQPTITALGTLTYTPAPGALGTATVTVRLMDDGGTDNGGVDTSADQTFTISVLHVNVAPSFTSGPDVTVLEDDPPQALPGWATDLSVGPPDESGQALTFFEVSNDNNALFSAQPSVGLDGTLTFTPAPNANGVATVTVRLHDNGGTLVGGSDTSPPQAFTITVTPVNDAPVLDPAGDPALTPVARDSISPPGDTVASFAGASITDVDGAGEGIAVVGLSATAQGTWEYSLNGGVSWVPFGGVAEASARLLRDSDRVRFVPSAGFSGTAGITYHAWDWTAGAFGGTADLSAPGSTGGTTAFSVAADTAGLHVGAVLGTFPEDTPAAHVPVLTAATILGSAFADAESPNTLGIAVTGVTGQGAWQYSSSGKAWLDLGVPTPAAARLLRGADLVRFVPARDYFGPASVFYRAWDQTSGAFAGAADLSLPGSAGGATAYSAAFGVASLLVTPVNDRPVLDVGGAPPLTPVAPGAAESTIAGDSVAALLGASVTDVDPGAARGIAVTAVSPAAGWQYNLGGGWLPVGPASKGQALLLAPDARVRFVPGPAAAVARLTYFAWDQSDGQVSGGRAAVVPSATGAFSSAFEVAGLAVTAAPPPPANHAPALNTSGAPTLTDTAEDSTSHAGNSVASLLDGIFSDADSPTLRGIAVTGMTGTGHGVWQYSLNGGRAWVSISAPASAASAVLLGDAAAAPGKVRLRFLPAANWSGGATISYRAWDQSRGGVGARDNLSLPGTTGGSSPFGAEEETAQVTVTPANDAPVLSTLPSPRLTPVPPGAAGPAGDAVAALLGAAVTDVDSGAVQGIAVTAVSPAAGWQYNRGGGWLPVGAASASKALLLLPTDKVRFLPGAFAGVARLSYKAWDQTTPPGLDGRANTAYAATGAFSKLTETATLAVNATPEPPLLNILGNPLLTPVLPGTAQPAGDAVASLLSGIVTYLDPDDRAGVAVVAASTAGGQWQYSLDGTAWLNVPASTAPAAALLLRSADLVRFRPDGGFRGLAQLSYRAWDRTTGGAGDVVDATRPGAKEFSLLTETAVVAVNTAPRLVV